MKKISDKEKLKYLDNLLESDMELKAKFIQHFAFKEKVKNVYEDGDLNSLVREIYDVFDGVDIELYTGDYGCGYGRYYDYDITNELCESIFLEIEKRLDDCAGKNDFYQALFILFAVQKAIDLSPSCEDPYCVVYDYDGILHDYFFGLLENYVNELINTQISFEDSKKYVLFLLDNSTSSEELENFESVFDVLICTKKMAHFAVLHISKFYINTQLKILDILEDNDEFISLAKQFYKENKSIAKRLLDKIHEVSSYKEYENIAKECFEIDNEYFVSDISKVIIYDKSKDFYLALLRYKALHHNNLDDYIEYKKYLNDEEIENLQESFCNDWRQEYLVEVLKYEKKYEKILKIAQTDDDIYIDKTLDIIKFRYPKECLKIIMNNCNRLLKGVGKNRTRYVQICRLLKIIINVPAIKNDINSYIKTTLVHRKPRLPALIDELTKARLIT